MSHAFYNALFKNAESSLEEIVAYDEKQEQKVQQSLEEFRHLESYLLTQYTLVANKLSECHDQVLSPQKRSMIKKLLNATVGRILEIKDQLVNIDFDNVNYTDDSILDLKISLWDAEMEVPRYYQVDMRDDVREAREALTSMFGPPYETEEEKIEEEMTKEDAILMIQRHERARKGRFSANAEKEREVQRVQGRIRTRHEQIHSDAALTIQTAWRGYKARKKMNLVKTRQLEALGILHPTVYPTKQRERAEARKKARRVLQTQYQEDYEETRIQEMERLRKLETPGLIEEISDEIRNWITDTYDRTQQLPEYPSDEEGGSAAIFKEKPAEQEGKPPPAKEEKKEGKKEGKKDEKPKIIAKQSAVIPNIKDTIAEYNAVWKDMKDLTNIDQKHYIDLIAKEMHADLEVELRYAIDQLMRQELDTLKAALAREKKTKRKAKKKKKRKGEKKKKKDPTQDRSLESLLLELTETEIIRKYEYTSILDFRGEHNFIALNLRQSNKDPLPCVYDVREVLRQLCILPLGSPEIRKSAPLVRSMLIAGPKGCGKTMLLNAICSELGAVLFDLTPSRINGMYMDSQDTAMLLHLVEKMSRLLQPAIILVDEAEKVSQTKKVPPEEKDNLKRLKNMLPKIVKGISRDDQVMLIGTTSAPWMGNKAAMAKTFDKFIYLPKPDYGTLYGLWHEELQKHSGINPLFDVSILAKISVGYTVSDMRDVMKKTFTCERILTMKTKPFTHDEIAEQLSKYEPVSQKDGENFLKWYNSSPLVKKKQQTMQPETQSKKK